MDKPNQTAVSEIDLDEEEHIEMESATGRFRRGAIKDAQNRAAAEALANNRRDMRISDGSFVAKYSISKVPKFGLFGNSKKCTVTDASISGLGIEAAKGVNKGDIITLLISDGKTGEVPEFEISATVMYAGTIDNKKARYGLQYDQSPTMAYTELLNTETLKHKMKKAAEDEDVQQAAQKKNAELAEQKKNTELAAQKKNTELAAQKKRIELAIQKKRMEKTALEREV